MFISTMKNRNGTRKMINWLLYAFLGSHTSEGMELIPQIHLRSEVWMLYFRPEVWILIMPLF